MFWIAVLVAICLLLLLADRRNKSVPSPKTAESPTLAAPAAAPMRMAIERLRKEEQRIGQELAEVQRLVTRKPQQAERERTAARAQWVRAQLGRVLVESVKVGGVGPRAFEALRAAGFTSVAALETLGSGEIPGIGAERARILSVVFGERRRFEEKRFGRLAEAEIDKLTRGALSDAQEHEAATQRQLKRQQAGLELRYSEIKERLREIGQTEQPVLTQPPADVRTEKIATLRKACPLCGGALLPRRGRFGPFIGCSSFPRCKYTSRISARSA